MLATQGWLQHLFTITVQDVMRKFKNLRTTYSRELHKIKGSQRSWAGADDVVSSTWVYYSSLDAFPFWNSAVDWMWELILFVTFLLRKYIDKTADFYRCWMLHLN